MWVLNLGIVLRSLERFEEAIASYNRALEIKPDLFQAYSNLGNLYASLANYEESAINYQKALEMAPESHEVHFNYAMTLLSLGDYENGLKEYEWRLEKTEARPSKIPELEVWDGDLNYQGELILAREQGLGDLIFVSRYGKILKEKMKKVSIVASDVLVPLLKEQNVFDNVYAFSEKNSLSSLKGRAKYIFLFSIFQHLAINYQNPLISSKYIHANTELVHKWKSVFDQERSNKELIIALNWQGKPETEKLTLKGRSFHLEIFSLIANLPNIKFVALQKGDALDQLDYCSFKQKFVKFQPSIVLL